MYLLSISADLICTIPQKLTKNNGHLFWKCFSHQVSFCELVLPFLIHDILSNGREFHMKMLSNQISRFFAQHCGLHDRLATSRAGTPMSQSKLPIGYTYLTWQTVYPINCVLIRMLKKNIGKWKKNTRKSQGNLSVWKSRNHGSKFMVLMSEMYMKSPGILT